jgi:tellurite resistance protein TerC
VTVPVWVWAAFLAFVAAMLALDVFVLHRGTHEISLREAGVWSTVWVVIGLGFGGLIWAWAGGGPAQAYLAGYLIEKSLSVDNIFLFAAIFSAFAVPARYQHRVLMFGIIGALVLRAAFVAAGISLLEALHPVIYVFGAMLLLAAVNMLRGGTHAAPEHSRALRWLRRWLPVTGRLHGQRFILRDGGRLLATPLLLALVVVETTDVIFAVDSIPAILAVTTDPFLVYTSNVLALLGMRALYFLLAGAAARLRYLRPGLAVILGAVAVKLLLADVWVFPAWSAPAFIIVVLAVAAAASVRDSRRARTPPGPRSGTPAGREQAARNVPADDTAGDMTGRLPAEEGRADDGPLVKQAGPRSDRHRGEIRGQP